MNLIEEHKESLKLIKVGLSKAQKRIDILKKNKSNTKEYYKEYYILKNNKHHLNSMKFELEFKIKWMETAREPDSRQGVDNHKAVECYK